MEKNGIIGSDKGSKITTATLTKVALMVVLITVGAFVKLPIGIVPVTLQTLFVILTAGILGGRLAFLSVAIYIFCGLVGLPVFTNGGGITYVLQPTFGYLIGFLVASFVVGSLSSLTKKLWLQLLISLLGIVVIYIFGVGYFTFITGVYLGKAINFGAIMVSCCLVFLPGDIVSAVIATLTSYKLRKIL